jgi:hypothetical protein
MTNPDLMRDDAINEYMACLMLDDAHQCAGLMKLCDTLENIGRIRELQERNVRRGYAEFQDGHGNDIGHLVPVLRPAG